MAVYLSPIGNGVAFLAANGQPAAGALINTYLAGTSTPAATYTTQLGNVANANPIVCSSVGIAPLEIWLQSGLAYKIIITDASLNQIGPTYDNIYGVGDPFAPSSGGNVVVNGNLTVTNNTVLGPPVSGVTLTVDAVAGQLAAVFNGDIQVQSLNSGQLAGFRNRIINGAMMIDQRFSGAAHTDAAGGLYGVDRWTQNIGASSKLTFQQVADAPAGFKYSMKVLVAVQTSPAASDEYTFFQPIEGQNVIDLQEGTATAQTVTLSFWAKASVAGTYAATLQNGASNRSWVSTFSFTTSWAKYSTTVTGDTAGSWATDNTKGFIVKFDLGCGTNLNTTVGAWQAANYCRTSGCVIFVNQVNGSTLNITGVQLEVGSVATPFEQRPIGTELALCQRYYQVLSEGQGSASSSAVGDFGLFWMSMRTTPTVGTPFSAVIVFDGQVGTFTQSAAAATFVSGNVIRLSNFSGLTQGRGLQLQTASIPLSAEL